MGKRDLLIVFDIDETLIQFIKKAAYHYWLETTPKQRGAMVNIKYKDYPDKQNIIFFRPGLKEFLEMANESGRIKVAMWTYSEREYAEDIAGIICDKFDLPKNTFIFNYGTEDIKNHSIPKSLQQIWDSPKFGKRFNKFNTVLVDDRYDNLSHDTNKENSILVQAFAPFGEAKTRQALTPALLKKAVKDDIFKNLTKICQNLLSDIDGCTNEEVNEAFKYESIFTPKCMARKKMNCYVKNAHGVELCTIGDVDNAADTAKGMRRRTKKGRLNTRRKLNTRRRKY